MFSNKLVYIASFYSAICSAVGLRLMVVSAKNKGPLLEFKIYIPELNVEPSIVTE